MRDCVMTDHHAAEHFERTRDPRERAAALRGKHIVLVGSTYPHPIVRGIARELVRLGLRTTVICSRVRGPIESGVGPEVLVTRSSSDGVLARLRFTREAAALLRRIAPDFVHVYAYRGCALLPY